MRSTLFCHRCILGRWVGDGIYHTCTLSPLTFKHFPTVEEMGVKCLYPGGDTLLNIGVCYKFLASHVILKEM